MILLEYEKQTFLDLVEADGLLVCAKGLSYDRVVIRILKAYSDSGNLVVVINSSDWEEQYYKSKIEPKYVHEVASTATEREPVYLEGRYRGELTKTFHIIPDPSGAAGLHLLMLLFLQNWSIRNLVKYLYKSNNF
ncbi:DNA repair endonuclease XPF-like [Drosophila simulans]|uniref:DNA repair endonuclease XPF-like n=1 Tax=Drosophila simulans TaxID=7240 RepID=UPI00192D11E2|nr:DNA repair endonuclease XPF-like [Drosophila simulans]